jgi:hypothetical protein
VYWISNSAAAWYHTRWRCPRPPTHFPSAVRLQPRLRLLDDEALQLLRDDRLRFGDEVADELLARHNVGDHPRAHAHCANAHRERARQRCVRMQFACPAMRTSSKRHTTRGKESAARPLRSLVQALLSGLPAFSPSPFFASDSRFLWPVIRWAIFPNSISSGGVSSSIFRTSSVTALR